MLLGTTGARDHVDLRPGNSATAAHLQLLTERLRGALPVEDNGSFASLLKRFEEPER